MTRFRLAAMDDNREVKNNEGHLHAWLDSVEKISSLNNVAFSDVQPGNHVLRVELRKSDHSLLVPPIAQEIRFTTVK